MVPVGPVEPTPIEYISNTASPNQLLFMSVRMLKDKSGAGGDAGAAIIDILVTLFAAVPLVLRTM